MVTLSNELLVRIFGGKVPKQGGGIGWRIHPISKEKAFHTGPDFPLVVGTKLYMPYNGIVVFSGVSGGYGLNVEVSPFGSKRLTGLAHLSKVFVKAGDYVKQGTLIALSGGAKNDQPNAGSSTGPHVHIMDGEFTEGNVRAFHNQSPYGKPMQWQDPNTTLYWDKPEDFEKERDEHIGGGSTDLIVETGYALELNRNVNVRTSPNTNAKIVRTLAKGAIVPYKAYIKTNGYDWKQLEDGNYIANGPSNNNYEYAKIIKIDNPVVKSLKVGDVVKIKPNSYYQGQSKGKKVSQVAYNKPKLTIDKIDGDNARIAEITSWIALKDLTKA